MAGRPRRLAITALLVLAPVLGGCVYVDEMILSPPPPPQLVIRENLAAQQFELEVHNSTRFITYCIDSLPGSMGVANSYGEVWVEQGGQRYPINVDLIADCFQGCRPWLLKPGQTEKAVLAFKYFDAPRLDQPDPGRRLIIPVSQPRVCDSDDLTDDAIWSIPGSRPGAR